MVSPELQTQIGRLALTVVESVLAVAIPFLARYAVKLFKTKVENNKNILVRLVARRLVRYAFEQIDIKEDRAGYVAQKLIKRFPWLKFEEVRELIEEAVTDLKAELKEAYEKHDKKSNKKGSKSK